jgi:hypothetical protein
MFSSVQDLLKYSLNRVDRLQRLYLSIETFFSWALPSNLPRPHLLVVAIGTEAEMPRMFGGFCREDGQHPF